LRPLNVCHIITSYLRYSLLVMILDRPVNTAVYTAGGVFYLDKSLADPCYTIFS